VQAAGEVVLPARQKQANKPWISQETLDLVDEKRRARAHGDWELEKTLRKQVHKSAGKDRTNWLQQLAVAGDWASLRSLRKGRKKQQGRLYNSHGEPVNSEQRPETFAEHLETMQWRVRPVTLIPNAAPPIFERIPVDDGPFTENELLKAIAKMKNGKAVKKGDAPIEVFKALAADRGDAFKWVLEYCNKCLLAQSVPEEWATASVTMIYKKGDPGNCDNYRPICLLSIASKLFASVLKQRLLDAGIDKRLWSSQFGFRRGCSTEDAIFIARRRIELARAQKNGRVSLLALDWSKAFDSINTESLQDALRRAGLPDSFLNMMHGMLRSRRYIVEEGGNCSGLHDQRSGISQGCTLSPLLFIVAMSVLLQDAVELLGPEAATLHASGKLTDVVYADDTLLIGVTDAHLEEYLTAVCEAGNKYGMQLHFW
jgi:hypothetical protein